MVPYRRQLTSLLTLLGVGLAQSGAAAVNDQASLDIEDNAIASENLAISDDSLNDIRGGFATSDGLQVAFGIERAVFVNGNLVTTTSYNFSDLGKLVSNALPQNLNASVDNTPVGGAQAAVANPEVAVTMTPNGMAVVQNGPGNTFQPGTILPTNLGTVIQNSLDNQKLQNVTYVQATVNSMALLKSMNLQNLVSDAINHSLAR